jgi:hypothetical protein
MGGADTVSIPDQLVNINQGARGNAQQKPQALHPGLCTIQVMAGLVASRATPIEPPDQLAPNRLHELLAVN